MGYQFEIMSIPVSFNEIFANFKHQAHMLLDSHKVVCVGPVNNDIKLGVGLGNQMLILIRYNKGLEWLPVMKWWIPLSALQSINQFIIKMKTF